MVVGFQLSVKSFDNSNSRDRKVAYPPYQGNKERVGVENPSYKRCSTRSQSTNVPTSADEKICGSGGLNLRRIYPIASWAETGGSGTTPAIRLLRPFVTLLDFPEKSSAITTLFKISDISNEMCDILKTALASNRWQCRGSGQGLLLPNHSINGFYGCRKVL